ncbi:MAG: hypothetical protein ACRCUT_00815, partial [Spirochaetota bacterium]
MNDIADTKFFNFFLGKYDRSDYVRLKSAQFTLLIGMLFAAIVILMTVIAWFFYDKARFLQLAVITVPGVLTSFCVMVFIRRGRNQMAANILAIACACLCVPGYLIKPAHLGGVSMVYFMFVNIVFAALFCRVYISAAMLAVFLSSQAYYYFFIAAKSADVLIGEASKTAFVDGPITLIIVYGTCIIVYRFLHKSLEKMEGNADIIKTNLVESNAMSNTLKQAAVTLNNSIESHYDVLTNFSTNLSEQAASLEEITATVEEITSATDSVSDITDSQYESLNKLLSDFTTLSLLIDN